MKPRQWVQRVTVANELLRGVTDSDLLKMLAGYAPEGARDPVVTETMVDLAGKDETTLIVYGTEFAQE